MRSAGFGSVQVSIVGLEPYPSQSVPIITGFHNGVAVWTLQFTREDMMRAYNVFTLFATLAQEAFEAAGQASDAKAVASSVVTLESFLQAHVKRLTEDSAPQDELSAAKQALTALGDLRTRYRI